MRPVRPGAPGVDVSLPRPAFATAADNRRAFTRGEDDGPALCAAGPRLAGSPSHAGLVPALCTSP